MCWVSINCAGFDKNAISQILETVFHTFCKLSSQKMPFLRFQKQYYTHSANCPHKKCARCQINCVVSSHSSIFGNVLQYFTIFGKTRPLQMWFSQNCARCQLIVWSTPSDSTHQPFHNALLCTFQIWLTLIYFQSWAIPQSNVSSLWCDFMFQFAKVVLTLMSLWMMPAPLQAITVSTT